MIVSNRRYLISFIEGTGIYTKGISIHDIINAKTDGSDSESFYAIQENIDAVLDLKVGERLIMSFNRDNQDDSQGFIKRIK